ncbi:hypothetical protein AMELA_G00234830, partial [Ameiurus melas]
STSWVSRRGLNTGPQGRKVKLLYTETNTSASVDWLKPLLTLDALHKMDFRFVFFYTILVNLLSSLTSATIHPNIHSVM